MFAGDRANVVVLEPNPRKVAFGRTRSPNVTFIEGRAESIPFPDGSFDGALAMFSFHHMEDQDQALDEVRRVLRPDGRILVQEFHPSSAPGSLARRLFGRRHGGHHRFCGPVELVAKLEAHGFRDLATYEAERGYLVGERIR